MTAALDEAIAGRGRLFLVSGEPGIGKSRLADELATRARGLDVQVLWGRCWEAGGAPVYWPWVQSLRSYVRGLDPETLDLSSDAAARARGARARCPRRGARLTSARARGPGDRPLPALQCRSRVSLNAGQARTLMLVLDDLHAADTPSLLLLQFLAAEVANARLLLVGTYRDVDPTLRDPLSSTLAELTRLPGTRMLPLSGLERPEVAAFVGEGPASLQTTVSSPVCTTKQRATRSSSARSYGCSSRRRSRKSLSEPSRDCPSRTASGRSSTIG